MSIRTILAAASGGAASAGALDLAAQLARRFEAHLEGYHVLPDPAAVLVAAGEGLGSPASAALAEGMMQEAAAKAAQARILFDDIVGRHGIGYGTLPELARRPSAGWQEATGNAATLVARRGRFFDLVVLGRSDRVVHEPHSDTIEETLVHSGRPVLLAPAEPPSGIGYIVGIAWNGSPQAVRALAAALPFLATANAVSVLSGGEVDEADAMSAVEYLAWHGVQAEQRKIAAVSGRRAGQTLLDAARDAGADLLVMGGYGHTPWREFLLGGATRSAVAAMTLPLLLMH